MLLRSSLLRQYKRCHRLACSRHNIMAIATQKEKLKQQEESRDFFCVVSDAFRLFARRSSTVLGSAWAFGIAILIIVIWGLTGPAFHYSNTWQLIINTGTTIVTFLMVFLIQNTQIWKNLPTKIWLVLRNSSSESEKRQSETETFLAA